MKKILLLMLILAAGCVNNEVTGEKVDKTKSITVWHSDLKLHYDRLTVEKPKKEEGYAEAEPVTEAVTAGGEETAPEEKTGFTEAEPSDSLDSLIVRDVEKKVIEDEENSKKREKIKKIEEKPQEKRKVPKKVIWIVVLTALISFGGYFTAVGRRRDEDKS